MASETENPPTANFVARAFVEQYYHILHHTPESVYRFYQDSSVLSRPDSDGEMISVTTMQGINEKILSFDYKEYKAEIKTADAQESYKGGVTVLVTGCLTGKDKLKRKFVQSFFLAPQDNGFFVLNDVFRYVEDGEQLENHPVFVVDDVTTVPEPVHIPDPPVLDQITNNQESDESFVEEPHDASNHEKLVIIEETTVIEPPSQLHDNDVLVEVESTTSLDDGLKKSYASIVKVAKGNAGLTEVYVPTNTVKVAPKKTETRSHGPPVSDPVPEALAPSNDSTPKSSNDNEEVEGHSVYIKNLPFSLTAAQLETEFKNFGPIKPRGVQVRNNRQQGYCFGFVEFESFSSMDNAIKASPILIGGHQAVIEMKRTTSRVGSIARGGRPPIGRGGLWSESFRGRGNYGTVGGRSFGRNEYVNRDGEFFGRGRASVGRGGEGYQGRGRTGRPSGPRHVDST